MKVSAADVVRYFDLMDVQRAGRVDFRAFHACIEAVVSDLSFDVLDVTRGMQYS